MSDKNSILDLLQSSQASKEITQNELNCAFSPSSIFALRSKTTDSLTWGFYGGKLKIGAINYVYSNSTILLTNDKTNYIQLNHTTALIEVNQVAFTEDSNYTAIYSVVCASNVITDWTDYRTFLKISGSDTYTLPKASTTVLGGVKVDGTTITIDANGVISSSAGTPYSLPKASTTVLGGVKVDGTTIISVDGVISSVGGGSTSFSTNKVFSIISKTGLIVEIAGGKAANLAGKGIYNNLSNVIDSVANKILTLSASTTGYIVYKSSTRTIESVLSLNIHSDIYLPLYFYTTNLTDITILEDVTDSFTRFNMFNPVKELKQDTFAVSSNYSFTPSFLGLNASGPSWNILPRRIMLTCKTAELGYAVGNSTHAVLNEPSISIAQNNVRILTQATVPSIMNRTTLGTVSEIDISKWSLSLVIESIM